MRRSILTILLAWIAPTIWAQDSSSLRASREERRVAELELTVENLQRKVEILEQQSRAGDVASDADPKTICTHGVIYDEGWTLRPYDPGQHPYELTFSFFNQFRYTGFASNYPSYVNSAGNQSLTPSRNDFDLNRGRIILSGYAIDPLLEFYANVDYNTVSDQPIQMLLAWIRHPLSESFNVAYGLGKVPGTWEWVESSQNVLGADASLATTFFRPSMTSGVWIDGEFAPGAFYKAMIGNGFNTFTLNASMLDTHFVYSGMTWWEPLEPFGEGFSDFENHESTGIRLGHGLTFARQDADPLGEPGPEQTHVRLSDGTRLVEPDALAPGATVSRFDLYLYALHAGWKYKGVSVTGEYFFRWLSDIQATSLIPKTSIYDHGFFVQSGVFVVPQSVELYAVGSAVFGPFGDGSQIGGGLNWYIKQTQDWRFTCDVVRVNDSPAQQNRTGYVAGGSGMLFRTQLSVEF